MIERKKREEQVFMKISEHLKKEHDRLSDEQNQWAVIFEKLNF